MSESEPKPEIKEAVSSQETKPEVETKQEVEQKVEAVAKSETEVTPEPETKSEEANDEKKPVKKVSFSNEHLPSTPLSSSITKSPSILKKTPENPPPRPARPSSPISKAKKTLKEAFPQADDKQITALLIASEGELNPAFNALLYLSDPDLKIEVPKPKPPPRRPQKNSQLLEDERLARRLAREFNKQAPPPPPPRKDDDLLGQFIDEDLPQIKKQVEKGFEETTKKIGTFFLGFAKQFGPESDSDDDQYQFRVNRNRANREAEARRQKDLPQSPKESEKEAPLFGALGLLGLPPTSARNLATFKREEGIELVDNLKDLPKAPEKKWEPLEKVAPHPVEDAFLVTSSDEEN